MFNENDGIFTQEFFFLEKGVKISTISPQHRRHTSSITATFEMFPLSLPLITTPAKLR